MSATFTRVFAGAHRVWNDPGKCSNIHGHNYEATVTVDVIHGELNAQGFVLPFDAIKAVIDHFDHALILDAADELAGSLRVLAADDPDGVFARLAVREVPCVPSTENMAALLAERIHTAAMAVRPEGDELMVTVGLRETAGIYAKACAPKLAPRVVGPPL